MDIEDFLAKNWEKCLKKKQITIEIWTPIVPVICVTISLCILHCLCHNSSQNPLPMLALSHFLKTSAYIGATFKDDLLESSHVRDMRMKIEKSFKHKVEDKARIKEEEKYEQGPFLCAYTIPDHKYTFPLPIPTFLHTCTQVPFIARDPSNNLVFYISTQDFNQDPQVFG